MTAEHNDALPTRYEWEGDRVETTDGVVVPVRATARRPRWTDLPSALRSFVEGRLGATVVAAWSAGTGFTPGFASRLRLDDGRDVFVKAASSDDDSRHGFSLSDAYRQEIRKLLVLPDGVGAPPLLWHVDAEIGGARWVVAANRFIDGAPPRRPWRADQLDLVVAKLGEVASRLTPPPPGLELESFEEHLLGKLTERLDAIHERLRPSPWLDRVERLCIDAAPRLAGDTLVHMDLRDDNVLIDGRNAVWIVDWNWPVVGASWIDGICLLLSARGDGIDVERILAEYEPTADVEPESIDSLLAVLWSFWAVGLHQPVPRSSPHLRDHQRWYEEVTRQWLTERFARG